ncbi:Glycolipid anchored surface GAS1 protein [Rutstroemia sp. NJR-2017a WRK4]|nr:Glycolipid anchored surface GAS1 protein [Rutstroemia sp. NJR-2017a WRK4]
MFWTIARRAAQQTQSKIPFDIYQNPYKAKRLWPPDFAKLSQKHQFRLERRYKRRAKLKWARPGWTKGVKIVQLGSILFVIVYGVLFADWSKGSASAHSPFDGIRKWFFGLTDSTLTRDTVRRRVEQPNSASPVVDARK